MSISALSRGASPAFSYPLDPVPLITPTRPVRTLSRNTIAFLITQGHLLVLHHALVYRMNGFLATHPGGALPVLHFIGRDATDEIEAYHNEAAFKKMKHFVVGKVTESEWVGDKKQGWKPLSPPVHLGWPGTDTPYAGVPTIEESLDLFEVYEEKGYPSACSPPGTTLPFLAVKTMEPAAPPPGICPIEQQRLNESFRALRRELLSEPGLFKCSPLQLYATTMYRGAALFTTFIAFYMYATSRWHYAVSAVALGFFMHTIMFCAHDAGHTEITGNRFWDRVIGGVIASYASGMSLGWWIDQHDTHHLVPNHPEHDPDIQLLPFFAFNTVFFNSIFSTFHNCTIHFDAPARFLVQYQHIFFYPVMVFARFSLFGKSYCYLLTKAKPDGFRTFEMVGVVFFWCWYTLLLKNMGTGLDGWVTRVMYCLLVLLAVCPIHVQIVLSHSAQDSEDMGVYEGFVHRQLRTTMDVSCPAYLDFVHGGLQMQIAHHLFPRLPRPNLRFASVRIKAWAAVNNIEFKEKSFTAGNGEMVGMLGEIAGQWRAMQATADDIVKGRVPLE